MIFTKNKLPSSPDKLFLDLFLEEYWFAPQDVLLRSIEANIWKIVKIDKPSLDIGIGDGGISRYIFWGKEPISIGIDPNPVGLTSGQKTENYNKILKASAEKMPFKNATFKTIVSNSTFEHIKHDYKALKEVGRTLKKGGHFFLTVPSEYLPLNILEIEGNNQEAKKALNFFNNRVAHYHYHSVSEWTKRFEEAGMKVVFSHLYYGKFITKVWYVLFKISTKKIKNKEIWSYLAHTRLRILIPVNLYIKFLRTFLLFPAFKKGFFCSNTEKGSMLFIVGEKI